MEQSKVLYVALWIKVGSITMSKAPSDDEWFELSDDLWLDPGEKRQKVRLLADHNVPQALVEEIRANGIAHFQRSAQRRAVRSKRTEQKLHGFEAFLGPLTRLKARRRSIIILCVCLMTS
jgi:hypothetical protein